jgi:hypothetical protein
VPIFPAIGIASHHLTAQVTRLLLVESKWVRNEFALHHVNRRPGFSASVAVEGAFLQS